MRAKQTKSFYLSSDVIEVLDQWPQRERSGAVEAVLRKHLRPPQAESGPSIDEARVRALIQEVLEQQGPIAAAPDAGEQEKARATSALAAILGMREEA